MWSLSTREVCRITAYVHRRELSGFRHSYLIMLLLYCFFLITCSGLLILEQSLSLQPRMFLVGHSYPVVALDIAIYERMTCIVSGTLEILHHFVNLRKLHSFPIKILSIFLVGQDGTISLWNSTDGLCVATSYNLARCNPTCAIVFPDKARAYSLNIAVMFSVLRRVEARCQISWRSSFIVSQRHIAVAGESTVVLIVDLWTMTVHFCSLLVSQLFHIRVIVSCCTLR
jgi:hypothetical protein